MKKSKNKRIQIWFKYENPWRFSKNFKFWHFVSWFLMAQKKVEENDVVELIKFSNWNMVLVFQFNIIMGEPQVLENRLNGG